MNSKLSWLALRIGLTLLLLSLALGSGCKSKSGGWSLFVRDTNVIQHVTQGPATTNVMLIVTNVVARVNGSVITNWITNFVEAITPGFQVTNLVTNVVVLPNPRIENFIGGAKTVNELANPTPFAPAVSAFLGLAATALGFFARIKTKQANEKSTLLDTVIQGVELAKSPETKAQIQTIARATGVEAKLNAMVKSRT